MNMQTLNVHTMHYHTNNEPTITNDTTPTPTVISENNNSQTAASNNVWNTHHHSPTNTNNNNSPTDLHALGKPNSNHIGDVITDSAPAKRIMSPTVQANINNTVSAAADSSDTQITALAASPTTTGNANASPAAATIPGVSTVFGSGSSNNISAYDQQQYGGHHNHQPQQQHPQNVHPQQQQQPILPNGSSDMSSYFMANQAHGISAYDSFYNGQTMPGSDFGVYGMTTQQQAMHDYKTPSSRFHPYDVGTGSTQISATASAGAAEASPRTVSSSGISPQHQQQQQQQQRMPPPGHPTPSPSPKQCDKCSFFCETSNELTTHYMDEHGIGNNAATNASDSYAYNNSGVVQQQQHQQHQQQYGATGGVAVASAAAAASTTGTQPIKEENTAPAADILDLDSQKMVYPSAVNAAHAQHGPLPPMHSLHPMHSRGMMWGQDAYHPSLYGQQTSPHMMQMQQQQHHHHLQQQQQQQHHNPQQPHHHHLQQQQQIHHQQHSMHAMHQQHHGAMAQPQHHQIKDEFGMQPTTTHLTAPVGGGFSNGSTPKPFGGSDVSTNSHHNSQVQQQQQQQQHLANSPSEFPSTTTPQELPVVVTPFQRVAVGVSPLNSSSSSVGGSTFEAATSSSLPTPTVATKANNWKSNEARRPKTYNCTACNKWFTSSGHLKRHYNTTLHKNAVKSSGIVDPATKPTSMFHHPDRDQNKLHKVNHNHAPASVPPVSSQAGVEPPSNASSHGSDSASESTDYAPYTPALGFPQGPSGAHHLTNNNNNNNSHSHHNQHMFKSSNGNNNSISTSNNNNTTTTMHGGHPNGQAGPSVQTNSSQPRGLQFTMTNTTGTTNNSSNINSSNISHTSNNISRYNNELHHLQQLVDLPQQQTTTVTRHHRQHTEQSPDMLSATENPFHHPQNTATMNSHYNIMETSPEPLQQLQHPPFSHSTSSNSNHTTITSNSSNTTCPAYIMPTTSILEAVPEHWVVPATADPTLYTDTQHTDTMLMDTTIPIITPTMPTMPDSIHSHSTSQHYSNNHTTHHQQPQQPSSQQQQLAEQQQQPNFHHHHHQDHQDLPPQPQALPSIRHITGNHHYMDYIPVNEQQQLHDNMYVGTLPDTAQSAIMRGYGGDADFATDVATSVAEHCPSPDMPNGSTMRNAHNVKTNGSPGADEEMMDYTMLTNLNVPDAQSQDSVKNIGIMQTPAITDLACSENATVEIKQPNSPTAESTPFNTPPHTPSVVILTTATGTAPANRVGQNTPSDNGADVGGNDSGDVKVYRLSGRETNENDAQNEIIPTKTVVKKRAPRRSGKKSNGSNSNNNNNNTNNDELIADQREVCSICHKTFNRLCYLTQHNQSFHSGARPFKCETCGKRFASADALATHVTKHGGNKPFKCVECPKQFNHKTDLRRHMCLHQGVKPHQCEECGKSFVRRDHKVKHVQTHARRAAVAAEKENRNQTSASGGSTARRAKVSLASRAAASTSARAVLATQSDDDTEDVDHDDQIEDDNVDDYKEDRIDGSITVYDPDLSLSAFSSSATSVVRSPLTQI